jgi:hypothetical protein
MPSNKPASKKEGGITLKSDSAKISRSQVAGGNITGLSGDEVSQIIETLLKHFQRGYLQNPGELDKTLSEFRSYHEKLHEYKELHNAINEIQNDFGQFKTEIDRSNFTRSISKLSVLRNLWRPVSMKVAALLHWSQSIQLIGKPFKILEDKSRTGEEWAIQFSGIQTRMNDHLGMENQLGMNEYSKKEVDYPSQMQILRFQSLGREIPWWETLSELTSSFDNTCDHHMNSADKQLRQTAQDLYNLSKKSAG